MKTLPLSLACLCSAFTFVLQAEQPILSDLHTFQDVCDQLNGVNISHMDLRIAKANMLLNSKKFADTHEFEFPGLHRLNDMHVEYKSPIQLSKDIILGHKQAHVIGNLICEIDTVYLSGYSLQDRLEATREIYTSLYDLAKKKSIIF